MQSINHLVYYHIYKNAVLHEFLKSTIEIYESFLNDGEGDHPVIESVNASKGNVSNYVSDLKSNYEDLVATLNVPRKFIISQNIIDGNKTCIRLFGDIKRIINVQLNNTKSEASVILNNQIRIYKNLSKMSYEEAASNITVFLKKMNTIEFKPLCTELKINDLLTKLATENQKVETLILERGEEKEKTVYSASPARSKCKTSYYNLIEYTNSMIQYNGSENYDTLTLKLNAIINPMNEASRAHFKKKDDKPVIKSEVLNS